MRLRLRRVRSRSRSRSRLRRCNMRRRLKPGRGGRMVYLREPKYNDVNRRR